MPLASGYWTTWGTTTNKSIGAVSSREILVHAHHARLRQSDLVIGARLFFGATTGLTAVYVKIWRPNDAAGATFSLVGQSSNLVSLISAGTVNELYFTTPIGAQEGDYVSVRLEGSANGVNQLVLEASDDAQILEITNSTPSATAFDWLGQSATSGLLKVQLLTPACKVAWIGYSNVGGATVHRSFCQALAPEEDLSSTSIASTTPYQFSLLSPVPYQNLGIGGQTAADIRARFVRDVLASGAELVVIHAGGNDVLTGVAQATSLSDVTTMLDLCRLAGKDVLVLAVLPGNAYTDAESVARDALNAALASLVSGYPNARFVDPSSRIGQARSTGPAGNLWDQQAQFANGDGLHYNAVAHRIVAHVLHKALSGVKRTLVNGGVSR